MPIIINESDSFRKSVFGDRVYLTEKASEFIIEIVTYHYISKGGNRMKSIRKHMKQGVALILAVMMTVGVVFPQGSTALAKEKADRTVLIYVCGSNIEHEAGYFSQKLNQMMEANIADGVNVLVLTGGSKSWNEQLYTKDNVKVSTEYNQVWKMSGKTDSEPHGYLTLLEEKGVEGDKHLSMDDPRVLKAFFDYASRNYSADAYDFIFIDHGMGPGRGCCSDDVVKREDGKAGLSIADMTTAIAESGIKKFNTVNFYCCLMGNIEIATAFAPYTDYMITSSEVMPGTGEELNGWLESLSKNPAQSGWTLGKQIVDESVSFYENAGNKGDMTLAVINTKNLKERLLPQMKKLSAILLDEATNKGSKNGKYNFYDEIYSRKLALKYAEPNLYELGNIVNALGMDISEPDNSTSEDLEQLKNKYTETAMAINDILTDYDESGDEVVYAKCTSGMRRPSEVPLERGADGNLVENKNAMIDYTGLSICFGVDCTNQDQGIMMFYLNAIDDILATNPDAESKAFYEDYRKAMLHYHLIAHAGNAVSALSAQGKKNITLDDIKEYWKANRIKVKTLDFTEYELVTKALAKSGATEAWLSDILNQQIGEVISSDKVSVNTVEDTVNAGDKATYRVGINGTPLSVVEGAYMKLTAKVKNPDGGEDMNLVLSPKAASGLPYNESIYEYWNEGNNIFDVLSKMYGSKKTGLDIPVFDNKWFVLKSTDGSKSVITCDSEPDIYGNLIIPAMIMTTDSIATKGALKMHYDEVNNTGSIIGFLPGNQNLADTVEVDTEIYGMIDLSNSKFDGATLILIGKTEPATTDQGITMMTLSNTAGRGISVEKADLSSIENVAKKADGTPDIETRYYVKDAYGYETDITAAVKAADSGNVLKNLSHATIENIQANSDGTSYTADVKYNGTALTENEDYYVIKESENKGVIDLIFVGMGEYAGYQMKTVFTTTDLSKAKITLKKTAVNYNGNVQKPVVKSVTLDGKTVPASAYTVSLSAKSPKNAGTYTVTITGKANTDYKGTAAVKFTIKQVANTIRFKGKAIKKAVTYKVKKNIVDKKAQVYAVKRNGSGKITMTNKSAYKIKKYLVFKNNKVTIKKNAPKGCYRFVLTVASKTNWKKTTTKVITVKVQ